MIRAGECLHLLAYIWLCLAKLPPRIYFISFFFSFISTKFGEFKPKTQTSKVGKLESCHPKLKSPKSKLFYLVPAAKFSGASYGNKSDGD